MLLLSHSSLNHATISNGKVVEWNMNSTADLDEMLHGGKPKVREVRKKWSDEQ
jgi:hypothetical protein